MRVLLVYWPVLWTAERQRRARRQESSGGCAGPGCMGSGDAGGVERRAVEAAVEHRYFLVTQAGRQLPTKTNCR